MSMVRRIALVVALAVFLSPALPAQDSSELREQFDTIIEGLNKDSFERFLRAIDEKDMTTRIYDRRLIEPPIKTAFSEDFSNSIPSMFASSLPKSRKEILGTVVDFGFSGNEGRAVVRYAASGYRFAYHVYELRAAGNGRLYIVDWVDYYQGGRFTDEVGDMLIRTLPSKSATRNALTNRAAAGDAEIFQVSELFKAARDNKPERFFQIYDGLDDTLLNEEVVTRLNWHMVLMARDAARIDRAARQVDDMFGDNPLYSQRLIEYYISSKQFAKAIASLERLQQGLGLTDGAIESLKVSAALALGNIEDATKYAQQAIEAEPSLELAWWSVLRARTAAGDFGGAIEAIARLEDDFGESLSPQQLRKDPFLRVLSGKQEYLDWRASRQ